MASATAQTVTHAYNASDSRLYVTYENTSGSSTSLQWRWRYPNGVWASSMTTHNVGAGQTLTRNFLIGAFESGYAVVFGNVPGVGSLTYVMTDETSDPPDPEETAFQIDYGTGLEGQPWELRDAQGNVVDFGTFGQGGLIDGSIEGLHTLSLFVNGNPVSIPASVDPETGVIRWDLGDTVPGRLTIDPSAAGVAWRLQRPDGSIVANGTGPSTLGSIVEGNFMFGGEQTAEVYVYVDPGDGNGGQWVPTGVVLTPQNPTGIVVNDQGFPVPPPPGPDAAPTPGAPSPGAPGEGTGSEGEEGVSGSNQAYTPGGPDDGEGAIVDKVRELGDMLEALTSNMRESFTNIAGIGPAFLDLRLQSPGSNCTLAFGPVTIQVNRYVPTALREGLKLVCIWYAAVGFIGIMRFAFD